MNEKYSLAVLLLNYPNISIASSEHLKACIDDHNCCLSQNYKLRDIFFINLTDEGIDLCKNCHNKILSLCWKYDEKERKINGYVSYAQSVDMFNKYPKY